MTKSRNGYYKYQQLSHPASTGSDLQLHSYKVTPSWLFDWDNTWRFHCVADVRLLMMALRTIWMKHMAPSCAIQEAQSPCSVPGMISWLVDGRPTGWSLTTCMSAQNNTRHGVLFRCITLHVLVPWFITTALATVVYLRHLFKKFWKNCSWKIDKFLLKVTCTEQSKRISMHKL